MTAKQPLIACEHCASVFLRPVLQHGETAKCTRCDSVLWRYSGLGLSHWLALAISTAILFVLANAYPVASLNVQGMTQRATLLDAVLITWTQGHELVALMTGLAGFFLPLVQLSLLLWVLAYLCAGREPPGLRFCVRFMGQLRPWCMVPVFLLGVLVSVVKLAGMAAVEPGVGLAAFGALTVMLTIVGRLSPAAIWRYAEDIGVADVTVPDLASNPCLASCHVCGLVQALPQADADHEGPQRECLRCFAPLHYRKPDHLARTWALLIAAIILYIPANVLPVMSVSSVLGDSQHTIVGGVVELWKSGAWDIALIVFIASVVVPLTKLLALVVLAASIQRGSTANLRPRTRLYEMVEFIGQWSMLDVFVVILLAALANFHGLMEIGAGAGAAAFGMVVILTMLSAMSLDIRRGWDAAAPAELGEDQVWTYQDPHSVVAPAKE